MQAGSKFYIKRLAQKLLLIIICMAIVLGVFPVSGISQLAAALSSEIEIPVYDPALGSYTEKNGVLTADPYENCGFRGWYDKNGVEVSIENSFKIPSGKTAEDYIPVFYNFNLVKNGGFEEYEQGTDFKNIVDGIGWEGTCDSEVRGENDWTTIEVSSKRAHSGSKSLELKTYWNTAYWSYSGLDTNTQYTIRFYYNIDPSVPATDSAQAQEHYLRFVSVIDGETEVTARANISTAQLACKNFNAETGSCAAGEWKEVSVTFFTGDSTDIKLCIYYCTGDERKLLYLDDLSLIKDQMASPTYFNDDFNSGYAENWKASSDIRLYKNASDDRLKLVPKLTYGFIQSRMMRLKKGAQYEISFDLDLSEVTDIYVPKVENNKLVTDSALISSDNPNGYVWEINSNASDGALSPNFINFCLSTKKGSYGSVYDQSYIFNDYTNDEVNAQCFVTDDKAQKTYTKNSANGAFGFSRAAVENYPLGLDVSKLHVTVKFTAPSSSEGYLNVRLNGLGTYYIDNVAVSENCDNVDYVDNIIKSNAVRTLGTAIRTQGLQGMRHKTQVDKRLLTSDEYFGIRVTEYGTVAIRSEFLGGRELTLDGKYDYNNEVNEAKSGVAYSFKNGTNIVFYEDDTALRYTGVLTNIGEDYWNSDYTVRAYVKYLDKNGKEGIFYLDAADIAVYPISKAAYYSRDKSGEFLENSDTRKYLHDNIISKFTDKVITVKNASKPISTEFQGIRSTIYHATTFFPDIHGRTYTEEQAAIEMDRLLDSKVDNVRTRFASQWMWTESGWDWESVKMQAYYKWANMLQDRGISITLQAGWHLHDFIYYYDTFVDPTPVGYSAATAAGHSSIPEVNYLHGFTSANQPRSDIYGEDKNAAAIAAAGRAVGLTLDDNELAHYSVAAARYAEWIKQGLNAFKAHGIYNIEYVLPFTETGYERVDDHIYSYEEWTLMVIALHDALKSSGVRGEYKFIGPSQSILAFQEREWSFVEYLYSKITGTEYEDMLDIVSMHQYTKPYTEKGYPNTVYEPYSSYMTAEENFTYYNDVLNNAGVSDMEFWCDEYFAHAGDAKWWHNVGMQMTQFAAGLTAGINNGVNRFLTWQIFDTLWDSDATHGIADQPTGSGEFIGGVHAVGTCPSLIKVDGKTCSKGEYCECNRYSYSSYVPRVTYYGINLIGKYMNNENADVYETNVLCDSDSDTGGLYVSAINNDDGHLVILVVNTKNVMANIDVRLEAKVADHFRRYTYDPETIIPSEEAISIPSDKTIAATDSGTSIKDIVPPRSFVIYVS